MAQTVISAGRRAARAAIGIVAWAYCALAAAATLQISPVTIEMARGVSGAVMTLSNASDHSLYGQLRVFKWEQRQGEDVLSPTQALVASPPILRIPPGGQQVVRIVRLTDSAAREDSYRILVDEIPDPDTAPRSGIVIRMRYSVPVFVDNGLTVADGPRLSWTLLRGARDWRLRVENTGALHARLSTVWLVDGHGRRHEIEAGLMGYALPGQFRVWKLDIPSTTSLGSHPVIHASVNAKPVEEPVGVQSDPGGHEGGR